MGDAAWWALPWWVLPGIVTARLVRSDLLTAEPSTPPADAPRVSVICPMRNEAGHAEGFVRSVLSTTWPDLELIVVDDHSTDGTADLARRAAAGDPRLRVVSAPDLPAGWFGKQWACHHGAAAATGRILLFTDADTRHAPDLVVRSVSAMRRMGSDLLSVAGQQEMRTLWEQLVQPIVFFQMCAVYGGTKAVNASRRPRAKIANGQCFLVTREAYDRMDGHAAVRQFVAEDLKLAQQWCAAGLAVHVVVGLDQLSTRMYDSLRELVKGWGKNIWAGGRHAFPSAPWAQGVLRAAMVLPPLWGLLPPLLALLGAMGLVSVAARDFGVAAYLGTTFWGVATSPLLRTNPWVAPLNPLGWAVVLYIHSKAALAGDRVSWKDRAYVSS